MCPTSLKEIKRLPKKVVAGQRDLLLDTLREIGCAWLTPVNDRRGQN